MSQHDSHVVEISSCRINETVTHTKEIQPVELQEGPEVESITNSKSDVDHFETMGGEINEEHFHRMLEENDWTYS